MSDTPRFSIGTSVQVTGGPHKGRQGIVVGYPYQDSYDVFVEGDTIIVRHEWLQVTRVSQPASDTPQSVPRQGDRVKIINGEYRGFMGTIETIYPDTELYGIRFSSDTSFGGLIFKRSDFEIVDAFRLTAEEVIDDVLPVLRAKLLVYINRDDEVGFEIPFIFRGRLCRLSLSKTPEADDKESGERFAIGSRVKITSGGFKGLKATILEDDGLFYYVEVNTSTVRRFQATHLKLDSAQTPTDNEGDLQSARQSYAAGLVSRSEARRIVGLPPDGDDDGYIHEVLKPIIDDVAYLIQTLVVRHSLVHFTYAPYINDDPFEIIVRKLPKEEKGLTSSE